MPSKSPAQHRLMEAAAHTPGGYGGVPQSVGKEYAAADAGKSFADHKPRRKVVGKGKVKAPAKPAMVNWDDAPEM